MSNDLPHRSLVTHRDSIGENDMSRTPSPFPGRHKVTESGDLLLTLSQFVNTETLISGSQSGDTLSIVDNSWVIDSSLSTLAPALDPSLPLNKSRPFNH